MLTGLLSIALAAQDIAGFWRTTLARLAAEPVEAVETDAKEPLPYRVFNVEYRSLGGVPVRARLALPIRGGETPRPLPAIVTVPGYGGLQQGIMLDECQRGYAVLQVTPRVPEGGVDYLAHHSAIDRDRIAIAGTSQGGGIALAVAALDPLQLAPTLRVPVLVSAGGQDTTCPAATIRSVFDRIPSIKSLLHDPALPHTTSAAFYRLTWLWLDQYLHP